MTLALMMAISAQATRKPLTVADLTLAQNEAAAANPLGNYLNYQVEGACTWMLITPLGVKISTTAYVRHFLPDLLVSVYPRIGTNPLLEGRKVIDPAVNAIGKTYYKALTGIQPGSGDSGDKPHNSMDRFYEVSVLGNPAIMEFSNSTRTLPSNARPYRVYYSSLLDRYLWHNPELEDIMHPLATTLPGLEVEGDPVVNEWGPLYPRYGQVTQYSQYQAAAVIALRAAHIATRSGQLHLYAPIPTGKKSCGQDQVCDTFAVNINDAETSEFQRTYPGPPERHFDPRELGKNTLIAAPATSYGHQWTQAGGNAYAWLVWRKYQGCLKGEGKLVGYVKKDIPVRRQEVH